MNTTTIDTVLSGEEIKELVDFNRHRHRKDLLIIGKCGTGKDTVGEMARQLWGHGTDSLAWILKQIGYVAFHYDGTVKDRPLEQGLSTFRSILSSCYLDNFWRRILIRRRIEGTLTQEYHFGSPDDVLKWIKDSIFPTTSVSMETIDAHLDKVSRNRFGNRWTNHFVPKTIRPAFEPIDHVAITDCRFPNEYFLGLSLGAIPVYLDVTVENRIERILKRDGVVDPSRFDHESETALDFLRDNRGGLYWIDNNGTIEELWERVKGIFEEGRH